MNFLNPFALIGLIAAGIPVLLHLLNLRRLRTVDFSTLRFLKQIQETRVRRLKLQQILLLILRTLLIAFAVLAFARPTIPTSLPLLSSSARASVVILIDNSASMEASDGRGRRFRQAQDAAQQIIGLLKDGDEVCVMPLAGRDEGRIVGFTRTFDESRNDVERLALTEDRADIPRLLHTVSALMEDAQHAHREVYIVGDAQRISMMRQETDSTAALREDASIFLVRIGDGLTGLEQNISVDSVRAITRLYQPNRPLEVEAFIRNGSDKDATGVVCSMAFDGVRVTQRAIDLPAGATRSIVLAAPPQRRGLMSVAVELDDDAIDGDNARYLGVNVPPQARCAVIGSGLGADLVATALEVQGTVEEPAQVRRFPSLSAAVPSLASLDVVFLVSGTWTRSDVSLLAQFVNQGGGLVVFAQEDAAFPELLAPYNLTVDDVKVADPGALWSIRDIDEQHSLFTGVFKSSRDRRVVESPRISRIRPSIGGTTIASSDAGAFLSEGGRGGGRVIYVAVGLDGTWGPFGGTGLFAATVVRASLYTTMPRDQGVDVAIGQGISAPVPGRFTGEASFLVKDELGVVTSLAPVTLPSATILSIPPQQRAGVLKIMTQDSTAVMTVAVNAPSEESMLAYLSDDEWEGGVGMLTPEPDRVFVSKPGRSIEQAVTTARTGSELWPLFIVLALCCAVAESLVSRFVAQDVGAAASP